MDSGCSLSAGKASARRAAREAKPGGVGRHVQLAVDAAESSHRAAQPLRELRQAFEHLDPEVVQQVCVWQRPTRTHGLIPISRKPLSHEPRAVD